MKIVAKIKFEIGFLFLFC